MQEGGLARSAFRTTAADARVHSREAGVARAATPQLTGGPPVHEGGARSPDPVHLTRCTGPRVHEGGARSADRGQPRSCSGGRQALNLMAGSEAMYEGSSCARRRRRPAGESAPITASILPASRHGHPARVWACVREREGGKGREGGREGEGRSEEWCVGGRLRVIQRRVRIHRQITRSTHHVPPFSLPPSRHVWRQRLSRPPDHALHAIRLAHSSLPPRCWRRCTSVPRAL